VQTTAFLGGQLAPRHQAEQDGWEEEPHPAPALTPLPRPQTITSSSSPPSLPLLLTILHSPHFVTLPQNS
jgi:hypothetical protein